MIFRGKFSAFVLMATVFTSVLSASADRELEDAINSLSNQELLELESLTVADLMTLSGGEFRSGDTCEGSGTEAVQCNGACEDPRDVCRVAAQLSSATGIKFCSCISVEQAACGSAYAGMCGYGSCPTGQSCQTRGRSCACVKNPVATTPANPGNGGGGAPGGRQPTTPTNPTTPTPTPTPSIPGSEVIQEAAGVLGALSGIWGVVRAITR